MSALVVARDRAIEMRDAMAYMFGKESAQYSWACGVVRKTEEEIAYAQRDAEVPVSL